MFFEQFLLDDFKTQAACKILYFQITRMNELQAIKQAKASGLYIQCEEMYIDYENNDFKLFNNIRALADAGGSRYRQLKSGDVIKIKSTRNIVQLTCDGN